MNSNHGQLLAATLAGLIIIDAAAYAVGPALAADAPAGPVAQVSGVATSELLNVRMSPAGSTLVTLASPRPSRVPAFLQ
jgi:hypothetical protein